MLHEECINTVESKPAFTNLKFLGLKVQNSQEPQVWEGQTEQFSTADNSI